MADYLPVADLVTRAKNGEQQAWDALVERYAPLIWSICRRPGWSVPTPRMYAKPSGSRWWPTWITCAIRLRYRAGWPPRHGASADACSTPRTRGARASRS